MIYQFGEFEIDTQNYQLSNNGTAVDVEPKVYDLLCYLVVNRNKLVTRDELFENIWPGQIVSDTSLSNQIKAARKAIGDNGRAQSRIKTVHGRGYQFIVPTEEIASSNIKPDGLVKQIINGKLTSSGPSIAVLPFANFCSDTDKEYFCEGVTEDIRIGLSRFRELLVIARGSSFLLREKSLDATDVAEKLGVEYILQGSVRTAEDRVRITAQLLDGQTGTQIWGDTYDRILDNLFETQDDITQTIVAALARRIEQTGRESALKKSNNDLTVYDLLLRARHYFADWHGSKEDMFQARELYKRAAKLDPNCAAACSGIAGTYNTEFLSEWTTDRELAGELSFEYARKALGLDNSDSTAHLVLACAYRDISSNLDLAVAHLNKAINANPNDYTNYCCKCGLMIITGDFDESISCGQEAIRRSPLLPDDCLCGIGFAEYLSGRYERAIASFGEILNPDSLVEGYIAACYAQLGRKEEAIATAATFRIKNKKNPAIKEESKPESWSNHLSNLWHFKNPAILDHFVEGLRKATIVD